MHVRRGRGRGRRHPCLKRYLHVLCHGGTVGGESETAASYPSRGPFLLLIVLYQPTFQQMNPHLFCCIHKPSPQKESSEEVIQHGSCCCSLVVFRSGRPPHYLDRGQR